VKRGKGSRRTKNEEKTGGFLQRSREAVQTKTRKLRGSEGTRKAEKKVNKHGGPSPSFPLFLSDFLFPCMQ
jgi:hypothetical protein